MKIPKLRKHDKIVIRWIDSSAPAGIWFHEESVDTETPLEIQSIGYFLEKSKSQISICMGYHDDEIHGLYYIPIGCIIEITVVG